MEEYRLGEFVTIGDTTMICDVAGNIETARFRPLNSQEKKELKDLQRVNARLGRQWGVRVMIAQDQVLARRFRV